MRNSSRTGKWHCLAAAVSVGLAFTPTAVSAQWGSPKFSIEKADDRFSTNGSTVWHSQGNRISKRSIAGGRHIDKTGVFFDPYAVIDQQSGQVRMLMLTFSNLFTRDTISGAPLAFGTPQRVTFITGEGAPLSFPIGSSDRVTGDVPNCSNIAMSCSNDEIEAGMIVLTLEQYRRILNATALAAKVDGLKRSFTYETKDIDPAFLRNLKQFYDLHLASAKQE